VLLAPAESLPAELWPIASERRRFALVVELEDAEIVKSQVFDTASISDADETTREFFDSHPAGSLVTDGVLMLVASKGSSVTVRARGDRAAEAVAAIVALIDDKFGEGK
jgi:hypothetical protein